MPARERLEAAALLASILVLVAFLASFVLGLLRPATSQQALGGVEPSRLPAVEVPGLPLGRVEVLNGAGRAGLARQATEQLRSGGFDVVYFGNSGVRPDSSEVIDRVGNPEVARAAADRLGIARVRTLRDTTLFVDATVVLGKDWPRAAPVTTTTRKGIWPRIRGWLGGD